MKIYKIFLICCILSIFVLPNLNIEITANNEPTVLKSDFNSEKFAEFNLKKNEKQDSLSVAEAITMDMRFISHYAIYEPVGNIDFSGTFKLDQSVFDFTIFNNDGYLSGSEWIEKLFPPYVFNEDNFSNRFNDSNVPIDQNLYRVVTKAKSNYFVNYIYFTSQKILVLSLQIGHYHVNDLNKIISAINWPNNLLAKFEKMLEGDLLFNVNKLTQYNREIELNINKLKVKADVSYYLPWNDGDAYSVTQDWGANDEVPCTAQNAQLLDCSHHGLNGYAYDFGLPESTDIKASAAGTVSYVKTGETTCGNQNYLDRANYIVINHDDGKATNYYHLQSVDFEVGEDVLSGEKIGKSGKTGFTYCNDHLHFQKQSQGAFYTQSEPFYFAEYPNAPDGELQYPMLATSQNEIRGFVDLCTLHDSTISNIFVNSGQIYNCFTTGSITILPETNFYQGSEVSLRIE